MKEIKVTLNGAEKRLNAECSVKEAMAKWVEGDKVFAVAVNEQFIPKSNYTSTNLQDGDRVELLVPMQGG